MGEVFKMDCEYPVRQIPKLAPSGKCYICRKKVTYVKKALITLYNKNNIPKKNVVLTLKYCPDCSIPYADSALFSQVRSEYNGLRMCGFMDIEKREGIEGVREQMMRLPHRIKGTSFRQDRKPGRLESRRGEQIQPEPVRAVERPIQPESVLIVEKQFLQCPLCDRRVVRGELPITADSGDDVWMSAYTCGLHYQVVDDDDFKRTMANNPTTARRYFDKVARLTPPSDYVFKISLREVIGKRIRILYFTKNLAFKGNDYANVLDYHDIGARRILTQIFKETRTTIELDGIQYTVVDREDATKRILRFITLRKGGGKLGVARDAESELVDTLVYSSTTQCYEIMRATYDKKSGIYYMDGEIFRDFCTKCGNPRLPIHAYYKNRYVFDYSDLRDESIMYAFGYNVSQKDGLSDKARQEILADIIDLEIVSVERAINHIDLCIARSSANNSIAIAKWARDLRFLRNYTAKPERFIIANNVSLP